MCKENIAWKKHMRNRKTELKLRRQKIFTKNQHSILDSANKQCYNIGKNKGREPKENERFLKHPGSKETR